MLVSLVIAALTFVFAMAFLTGSMGEVAYYLEVTGSTTVDRINCREFVDASQNFVSTLEILSIVFILLAAFLFVTASNSRRNYYITNYIAVGLFSAFAVAIGVYTLFSVIQIQNLFYNGIAWEAGTNNGFNVADNPIIEHPLTRSSASFALGYALFVIVILDAAAIVLSTVWKIKLMKGEKKLLEQGFVKEAA